VPDDLYRLFPGYPSTSGSGKIVGKPHTDATHRAIVAEGWPLLLKAMDAGGILATPQRTAAFLTTLVFESWCEYDALQSGDRTFTGRGLIQLTTEENYRAAGNYLGVDLVGTPELARSLDLSARIAVWYWTVARPRCNEYADALRMGKINAAIGYPLTGSNDNDRCMIFAHALATLTGADVGAVDCAR
jgi:putative chitinase